VLTSLKSPTLQNKEYVGANNSLVGCLFTHIRVFGDT